MPIYRRRRGWSSKRIPLIRCFQMFFRHEDQVFEASILNYEFRYGAANFNLTDAKHPIEHQWSGCRVGHCWDHPFYKSRESEAIHQLTVPILTNVSFWPAMCPPNKQLAADFIRRCHCRICLVAPSRDQQWRWNNSAIASNL